MKNKLKNIYNKHEEIIIYFIVGTCAVFINFTIFNILLYLGCKENISNVVSVVIAVTFSYVTNKIFVYKTKCNRFRGLMREIFSFITARSITIALEIFGFPVLIYALRINPNIIKAILVAVIITLNYIFSKTFVFKPVQKKQ